MQDTSKEVLRNWGPQVLITICLLLFATFCFGRAPEFACGIVSVIVTHWLKESVYTGQEIGRGRQYERELVDQRRRSAPLRAAKNPDHPQ